jgi:hypothetical protein
MRQSVDAISRTTLRHRSSHPHWIGLIAIVSVASLVFIAAIAAASSGVDTRSLREDQQSTTVSAEVAVRSRPAMPPRVPMRNVLVATVLIVAVGSLVRPRVWSEAIRTTLRRRIDGAGDDWRALLLGAPPVQG